VAYLEEGESLMVGVGCENTLKLAKECADTLRKSHAFLKKMELEAVELDTAMNKAKNKQGDKAAQPPKEEMLGEIRDMNERIGESMEAPEPKYCLDTRIVLKKCHNQLFKVTAFIERVGSNGGQPRAGFPGSSVPSIPVPAKKSKMVKGSTNAPVYQNITMKKDEIDEAEDICKNMAKAEKLADSKAYKAKDAAGEPSEFKETTDAQISMLLQQRVNFFASERKNKKIAQPIPAPEQLPKCEGCWMRRRRAGRQGEVNSCPNLQPKAKLPPKPKPVKKAAEEEAPEDPPEPKKPDDPESDATKPASKTGNTTQATPKSNATAAAMVFATEIAGFSTPLTNQGKFYYGALAYQGKGAWSCDAKGGAEISCGAKDGSLPCELKGPKTDLSACSSRCKACDKCVGFNYVRNPVTKKEGKGNGGICIFFSKDPSKVPSKSCGPLDSSKYGKNLCKNPMKDKDFYCCSDGVFFKKKVKAQMRCLPCCNAAKAADKCDGPQCEKCLPSKKPTGSCAAAKACCKAMPPCDHATCANCPPQTNDGFEKKKKTSTGAEFKFNIPQASVDGPWKLDNYKNTDKYQKKFYSGAVVYKGSGSYTCDPHYTADVKSATKCTQLPKVSKLKDCKVLCDATKDCWGFNFVYNQYNNKYMGNSANDGGICIFLKDDPERSKVKSVACAGWQGKNPLCVNPGTDKAWNCCSEGYLYQKKIPKPVCTAKQEGGKGTEMVCSFPFKHEGKTYNKCIRKGSKTGAPWCTVDAKTGKWGYCNARNCKAAGVELEQTKPGSPAAKVDILKAKDKMMKALAPKQPGEEMEDIQEAEVRRIA